MTISPYTAALVSSANGLEQPHRTRRDMDGLYQCCGGDKTSLMAGLSLLQHFWLTSHIKLHVVSYLPALSLTAILPRILALSGRR